MTPCLISTYAQHLRPHFDRPESEGDFYGSPLRILGIPSPAANQVHARVMRLSGKGVGQPVTLHDMALQRDQLTPAYIGFKRREAGIIFHEGLLRAVPDTATTVNPDFFQGVDDYFPGSNAHRPAEEIYSILLHHSLACYSLLYRKYDLSLPATSRLQNEIQCEQRESLLSVYADMYATLQQKGALQTYLQQLATKREQGHDSPPMAIFFRKNIVSAEATQELTVLNTNTLNLDYQHAPWNRLLHKCKQGNHLDFSPSRSPFSFYPNHPRRPVLWASLLLQELDQHHRRHDPDSPLSEMPFNVGETPAPLVMNHTNNQSDTETALQDYIKPLTQPKQTPQTTTSKALHHDLLRLHVQQSKRLLTVEDTMRQTTRPYVPIELGSALHISQDSQQHWQLHIRIAEQTLADMTHSSAELITIYVDYYHDEWVTQVPCELLDEQQSNTAGRDYVVFTVALDSVALRALHIEQNLDEISCLAGVSGGHAMADIVVVFQRV